MPSPFPGMDPYIERPAIWSNMHHRLISGIADALNEVLPDAYVADITERVYIQDSRDEIVPDVFITTRDTRKTSHPSATATAVFDEPIVLETYVEEAVEPFIQIVLTKNDSRIVTEIEILSPSNKSTAGNGRSEYLEKQKRLLASDIHFIEIDLLRAGKFTVSCPRPTFKEAGKWDYIVSLHKKGERGRFEAWARSVRQPLPKIKVPLDLDRGDSDVLVDLQSVFTQCYDKGRFHMKSNYELPPDPPLNPEDAAWAENLLKEKEAGK